MKSTLAAVRLQRSPTDLDYLETTTLGRRSDLDSQNVSVLEGNAGLFER
jgi:hypothetical protein